MYGGFVPAEYPDGVRPTSPAWKWVRRVARHTHRSTTPDRDQALISWRAQRLAAAGFPAQLALRLADDHRIDLHELLGLIDRGCPPELAARILAPLDASEEPRT